MSVYKQIDEIRHRLKSEFGKSLTDEQIWYIRVINNDSYSFDEALKFYNLLGSDMDIICEHKDENPFIF